MYLCLSICVLCLLESSHQRAFAGPEEVGHYVNEVVIQVDGDEAVAELVAGSHGFTVKRKMTLNGNYFILDHPEVSHRSKRGADELIEKLKLDPNVKYVEQQRLIKREKREIVHDKQLELPIRHYADKSVYQRFYDTENDNVNGEINDEAENVKKKYLPVKSRNLMHFNDKYFLDQWYLNNFGQTGGPSGYDVNVVSVWLKGITGKGVVVCILDDGIERTHPDLKDNYDPKASYDLNDKDSDPTPNIDVAGNSHGTRCAGEVSAKANNTICGVGIAYNSRIGGVRMLDGPITDSLEAEAIVFNNNYIQVYSSSWGPTDDGKTMEGPSRLCKAALKQGAMEGRNGLGSIYMWATGNGGMYGDTCSCDGYVASIYTVAVGSIADDGLSTYFSEICPATIAVIFTGGSHKRPGDADYKSPKLKVTTTDIRGDCTLEFQGTSSASPLAAGCVALSLEVNPNLTWRDVQHIIVQTARIPNAAEEDNSWTQNGAGFHVNPRFGFGAMDCGRMAELAQNWTTVAEHHICMSETDEADEEIPKGGTLIRTLKYNCNGDPDTEINHLEHVEIYMNISHPRRGDLNMFLISPSGTSSEILRVRTRDRSKNGIDFTFMTVHNWGEDPGASNGEWTLKIKDRSSDRYNARVVKHGTLHQWNLTFYGTSDPPSDPQDQDKSDRTASQGSNDNIDGDGVAHDMDIVDLKHVMVEEEQRSQNLNLKTKLDFAGSENKIDSLRMLQSFVDKLSPRQLDKFLAGIFNKNVPHQRDYYDKSYGSFMSSDSSKLQALDKKSNLNFGSQNTYLDEGYYKKSQKRNFNDDVKTEDIKELVSVIEELLEDN